MFIPVRCCVKHQAHTSLQASHKCILHFKHYTFPPSLRLLRATVLQLMKILAVLTNNKVTSPSLYSIVHNPFTIFPINQQIINHHFTLDQLFLHHHNSLIRIYFIWWSILSRYGRMIGLLLQT